MADALSRDEIDALLRGMADGEVAVDAEATPRDVAQPLSLVAERDANPRRRFPGLTQVHDRFARELGKTLGALFEAGVTVERRETYAYDFATVRNRIAPGTMQGICAFAPLPGEGLVLIPATLAFEMVDRLFGGPGRVPPDVGERALSPIALRTVEGIAARAIAAFAAAFAPLLPLEARLLRSEPDPALLEIVPAGDPVIGFDTACDLGAGSGLVTIVLPQAMLESARNKLDDGAKAVVPRVDGAWLGALRAAVEQTEVHISADLGRLELSARQVIALRPGDVLHLPTRGDDALAVRIEGMPLMTAVAGVSRGRNAVRILGFDAADLPLGEPSA
jgi:flagellar motor switch protein FliM